MTVAEMHCLLTTCASLELQGIIYRLSCMPDVPNILSLMAALGTQMGHQHLTAHSATMAQEANEDPEAYFTHWALMQIMAGIVPVVAEGPKQAPILDDQGCGTNALRDCAVTLVSYYARKLGVWEHGQPATIGDFR